MTLINHLLSLVNLQCNVFQRKLKPFPVLQPVVLELYGAGLGPSHRQRAALCTPVGLCETVGKGEVRTRKAPVVFCCTYVEHVSGAPTSLGVSAYSLTRSTETMLFSTSVQDRTIQLRIPVTCNIQCSAVYFTCNIQLLTNKTGGSFQIKWPRLAY